MTTLDLPAEFTLHRTNKYDQSSPVRWIISHSRPYLWIVVMMILGAIGNAVLAVVVPILTGDAFNAMLKIPPETAVLLPLALTIGISQIIRGVLQLGRNFGAELLAQKMERDIRDELYLSLLGKSMTFHNLQPVGDTMARATNDVREVNYMFSPGINLVVGSFMFILMPLFFGPRYHPSLIATPLIFTIFYFISLARYLKQLAPITDEVRATFGEMNTHLSESLDGVEIMKGAAQEGAEVERFVTNARKVRNAFVLQGDLEARYIAMLLLGLAFAGGLVHSLFLFRAGLIDVGAVVGYFGMLQLLGFPTFTSTFAYSQISSGISSARRILELIQRETHLDQNASGRTSNMVGEIEFRGVSFSYPNGEAVHRRPQGYFLQGQARADRCTRRADGSGQDLPRQADQPHLRCDRRSDPRGWRGCARLESRRPALADLHHRTGYLPLLALAQRQHRIRQTRRHQKRRSSPPPSLRRRMTSSSTSTRPTPPPSANAA
jgi:ATP-binding cassette, subfamily B, bacterial